MLFGAQHLLDWMDIFSVGKKRYRKQILLNLDKGKGIMVFWRLTGTNPLFIPLTTEVDIYNYFKNNGNIFYLFRLKTNTEKRCNFEISIIHAGQGSFLGP